MIAAASNAGATLRRAEAPRDLPPASEVDLLLVDWSERAEAWGEEIRQWVSQAPADRPPRVVLYGPHTDLEAHAAARAAGLGPMLARSKLLASLDALFSASADKKW